MIIEVTEVVTDCRDSKDNKFLELAVSGGAKCIISGDNDLLVLDPFRGIPIITPQVFISVVIITNRIAIEIKDIKPLDTQALMDEIEARISDDFLF